MEKEFKKVELEKANLEINDKISDLRNIPLDDVKEMMAHKMWTPKQFADITGKDVSTIHNLMVKGKQVNMGMVAAVIVCHAFPNRDTHGPKFIVRDHLSEAILLKSLGILK